MSALPAGYAEFLDNKRASAPSSGFDPGDEVSDVLFGFQRAIVRWAVAGRRRAIFAAFGLGKSLMQLEAVRLVLAHDGGRGLIVCPLGVRQEFARDARLLGVEASFVRRSEEVSADGIYLTNYESVRDGRLDPGLFDVASLDEASVLRSFGSKTYQTFLGLFDQVPYRFVATATPSPNRYKELIHYAVAGAPPDARVPAAVRHRRPAGGAIQQPRRARVRPVRGAHDRAVAGAQARAAGAGGGAERRILARRREVPPGGGAPI